MPDFTFSCPKCRMDILCDESYAGTGIDCPTCAAKLKVPSPTSSTDACPGCHAALPNHAIICTKCGYDLKKGQSSRKVSGPPSRTRSATVSGKPSFFTLPKLVGACFVLGLLAALHTLIAADLPPEASRLKSSLSQFLLTSGFCLIMVTGLAILINAFRESVWWGLGFFIPFIGGLVSLVFVIKHWGKNRVPFLLNLAACFLLVMETLTMGDDWLTVEVGPMEWDADNSASAVSATPREAFNGFQTAAKQNDYSSVFKHLTPELQNEQLHMSVSMVKGAQMMRGDATMKKVADEGEAILKKHGLPIISFEEEMKNQMMNAQSSQSEAEILAAKYSSIADKGQLYQELANTLKTSGMMGEEGDFLASLASSPISEPSIIGNTARGEGTIQGDMKIAVHFKQTGGTWLISEIEMLDMGALMAKFSEQMSEWGGSDSFRSRKTAPEVEDNVLRFQREKAMAGNRSSQYDWGMRHLRGDGVEQDHEQARHWLKLAADQGHTRARKALAGIAPQQN